MRTKAFQNVNYRHKLRHNVKLIGWEKEKMKQDKVTKAVFLFEKHKKINRHFTPALIKLNLFYPNPYYDTA